MAVCKAEDVEDVWFIANNLPQQYELREYKKRFDIEEMFRVIREQQNEDAGFRL